MKAFTSTGLASPDDLDHVKRSIFVKDNGAPRLDKFYDQIAWFGDDTGRKALSMTSITESKDEDLAKALRSSLSSEVGRRRTRHRSRTDCTGTEGNYEIHLARPERLKTFLRPRNQPQPMFWRPRF